MLISEVQSPNIDSGKLAALAKFLRGRARDTDAVKPLSAETFIELANNQGIALTVNQLKDMIQRPPLSNIIADVTGDEDSGEIIFQGSDIGTGDQTMSVDQARDTVDRMAKRAAKKGI